MLALAFHGCKSEEICPPGKIPADSTCECPSGSRIVQLECKCWNGNEAPLQGKYCPVS